MAADRLPVRPLKENSSPGSRIVPLQASAASFTLNCRLAVPVRTVLPSPSRSANSLPSRLSFVSLGSSSSRGTEKVSPSPAAS